MHVYTEFWHFISPRFRLCVFVCPRITRGEMSLTKVCKDLSKLEESVLFEDQEKKLRPSFLVTDSKGRYLKSVQSRSSKYPEILWKSGAKSDDADLKRDILDKVRGKENPIVLIWLGTCDFTQIGHQKFISLNEEVSPDSLFQKLEVLETDIKVVNSSADVIFIECPIYSIVEWNSAKKHRDPSSFQSSDVLLQEKIEQFNIAVHAKNGDSFKTPKLSMDLLKNTKTKQGLHSRYFFNIKNLYNDGIHPCETLSKLWLRRLQKFVIGQC